MIITETNERPNAPIDVGPAFQREYSGVVSGLEDTAALIVRIHGAPAGEPCAAPAGEPCAAPAVPVPAAAAGAAARAGAASTRPPAARRTGAKHWPHHSASAESVAPQLAQLSISLGLSVGEKRILSSAFRASTEGASRLRGTPAVVSSGRE